MPKNVARVVATPKRSAGSNNNKLLDAERVKFIGNYQACIKEPSNGMLSAAFYVYSKIAYDMIIDELTVKSQF